MPNLSINRKRSAASHRSSRKDATAQTSRSRQAGSDGEGIRSPGCDSNPRTEAKSSGTSNSVDKNAIKAILTLQLELLHAHLWYLMEHRRRITPLSAQDRHQHKEIERHYGRPYLRGQVLPSKKSRLHADFDTNVRHLKSMIAGLDRLRSHPAFKHSPNVNQDLSAGK
jgi:hypothetical protein